MALNMLYSSVSQPVCHPKVLTGSQLHGQFFFSFFKGILKYKERKKMFLLHLFCWTDNLIKLFHNLFTTHDRKVASVYFIWGINLSRDWMIRKKVWILRLRQLRTSAWLYSVKLINCPSQLVPWVDVLHELNTWMKCIGNILIDQPQLFIRDALKNHFCLFGSLLHDQSHKIVTTSKLPLVYS